MIILISSINNYYYIGGENWFISFDYSLDLFFIIKDFLPNITEILVTTGPGSFISNRSILAFAKGIVSIKHHIKLYAFDILSNLLYINDDNIYFYVELDKFVYYIENNLTHFTYLKEFLQYKQKNCKNFIGNHTVADEYININFFFLFNRINMRKLTEKSSINIRYCDKFSV